jgi:hypothetical protein
MKNDRDDLAGIIHECRHEAAETEASYFTRPPQARQDAPLPGAFSHVRGTQAYLRSVEEPEREKPRRARGSAAVVGVHE